MNTIAKLFCDLVSIPSPSGKERVVGLFIQKKLKESGIESKFDATGSKNDSDSGNLIAEIKGAPGSPTILFVAHMDTVETGEKKIRPRISNGIITSDGTTILGADNKGSVAALIEALKVIHSSPLGPTIVAVFSTREEQGMMGTSLLNLKQKIDFSFNLDGQEPLGRFIYQGLGETPFTLKIKGRAAHAASEPEKGINALVAAAKIITKLKIGKDKRNVVVNIGKIQGGRGNNIVPDLVTMEGQIRAFTSREIDQGFEKVIRAVRDVCRTTGCTYELVKNLTEGAPPASIAKQHRIVQIARRATKECGLTFSLEKGSFTSDMNFLAKKFPTITVVRGSKNPHAFDESISVDVLTKLKTLIIALAHAAMEDR